MMPPSKLKDLIYRFNTKLMHIWFIISDYTPRKIIRRYKAGKEFDNIITTPFVAYDAYDSTWWVDTGHANVGPFENKSEAQMHLDRILSDRKKK